MIYPVIRRRSIARMSAEGTPGNQQNCFIAALISRDHTL